MPSRVIAYPQWRNFTSEAPTIDVLCEPNEYVDIDLFHLMLQGANEDDDAIAQFGFQGGWRLQYVKSRDPEHGVAEKLCHKTGFRYTPNPNYVGPDCFNYQFFNGTQWSECGRIRINVRAGMRLALEVQRCTPVPGENHSFFKYVARIHEEEKEDGQLDPKGIDYWDHIEIVWEKLVPTRMVVGLNVEIHDVWTRFALSRLDYFHDGSANRVLQSVEPLDDFPDAGFINGSQYFVGEFEEAWPYEIEPGWNEGSTGPYLKKQVPYPVRATITCYKDQVPVGSGWTWTEEVSLSASVEDYGENNWWSNVYVDNGTWCDPEAPPETDPCDCLLDEGCAEDGPLPEPPCLGPVLNVIVFDNTNSTSTYDPIHRCRDIAHMVVNEALRKFNTQAWFLFVTRQTMAPFNPLILIPTRDICSVRTSINKTAYEGADATFLQTIAKAVDLGKTLEGDFNATHYFVITDGTDSQADGTYTELETDIIEYGTVDYIRLNVLLTNTEQPTVMAESQLYYERLTNSDQPSLSGTVNNAIIDAPTYDHIRPIIAAMMTCTPCGVQANLDISYGSHENQFFDLYVPKCPEDAPYPLVILIHGGEWDGGDKQDLNMQPFIRELPTDGQAVITMNFRMPTEHQHPKSLWDINCVLNWVAVNASSYRIDATRVSVLGVGSGAHLAFQYALTPWAYSSLDCGWATPILPSLRRCVGVGGHYDLNDVTTLSNLGDAINRYVGADDESARIAASPITEAARYVGLTEFMICHADGDPLTPSSVSDQMVVDLRSSGAVVEHVTSTSSTHTDWMLEDSHADFDINYRVQVYRFIR
jgi:acetyl esterase/lipase